MSTPTCPRCHTEVGSTWRWCLACGYDPDGAAQRVRAAALADQERRSWRPVIVILAGLAVAAGLLWKATPQDTAPTTAAPTTVAPPLQWQTFAPADGHFRVELPGAPQAETSPPDPAGRTVRSWNVIVGGQVYRVATIEPAMAGMPAKASDEQAAEIMRSWLDGLAKSIGGQVAPLQPLSVDGAPAVRYVISSSAVGESRGQLALVGRRMYEVSETGRDLDTGTIERIMESFVLT